MKYLVAILLMALAMTTLATCPSAKLSDTELKQVENLNASTIREVWDLMAGDPKASTRVLINTLKVSEETTSVTVDNNIWRLRAIHALTGIRFKGVTKAELDKEQRHFLQLADGKINFYGTWMSRDMTWVAPRDAQQDIINQWQAWLSSSAKTHSYLCTSSLIDYYFF